MERANFKRYSVTVGANNYAYMDITGETISCYSSDGDLKIEFDNEGSVTEFAQGVTYPKASFRSFKLINDTASDISLIILVGNGDVLDSRLSVAGTLSVQNAAGDTLEVSGTSLTGIETRCRNIERNITEYSGYKTGFLAPKTTLENASFADVSNATLIVVSAVSNVSGIIIRTLHVSADHNHNGWYVKVGDDYLLRGNDSGSTTVSRPDPLFIKDIFIPSGKSLEMSVGGAQNSISMSYEVL